jgi:hypothetical protein
MQFYNYVAVSVLTMVTKAGWPYINVTKNKYFTLLTLWRASFGTILGALTATASVSDVVINFR